MLTINPSTCSISSASHPPEDEKRSEIDGPKRYTAPNSSRRTVNITENTGRKPGSVYRRCLSCCTPRLTRLTDREQDSISVATHLPTDTDIEKQDDVSLQPPAQSQELQEMVLESISYESNSSFPTQSKVVGFDSESEEIVKNIAAKMSEEKSTRIPLPEGWVVTIDDVLENHKKGLIIDNSGMPRISYVHQARFFDSELRPQILSYDEAQEEKSKVESSKAVEQLDTAAMDALRNLMGEQIVNDFIKCVNMIEIPHMHLNRKGDLSRCVNPVLDWYKREDNSGSIEQFLLNSKFKGTPAAIALNQFIEMFVINDDVSLVAEICRESAAEGFQLPDAVYNRWKALTVSNRWKALKSTKAD